MGASGGPELSGSGQFRRRSPSMPARGHGGPMVLDHVSIQRLIAPRHGLDVVYPAFTLLPAQHLFPPLLTVPGSVARLEQPAPASRGPAVPFSQPPPPLLSPP